MAEAVQLGNLGIDTRHYDLGLYDDFGSFDGAADVDRNDFWGGYMGDNDVGGFDDFDFRHLRGLSVVALQQFV